MDSQICTTEHKPQKTCGAQLHDDTAESCGSAPSTSCPTETGAWPGTSSCPTETGGKCAATSSCPSEKNGTCPSSSSCPTETGGTCSGDSACPASSGGTCPLEKESEGASESCTAAKSSTAPTVPDCGVASCPAASGGVCPLELNAGEACREMQEVPFPLHSAVRRLDLATICNLLGDMTEGSGEVDALNTEGWTALHVACAGPSHACAQILLHVGASVDAITQSTLQSPLHLAATVGSFSVVDLLLEARADVNEYEADQLKDEGVTSYFKGLLRDQDRHQTALHIAAAGSNVAMMRRLLDARAEIDAKDSYGATALHLALDAEEEEDDLRFGCGVRIQGIKSKPERNGKFGSIVGPFEEGSGRWPVLVEEGPPEGVLLKPENVETVFTDAVEFLLHARADVNLGNYKIGLDQSMLHEAVCAGNMVNVQRAIRHGANVNSQRAGSQLSPLHLAVRQRNVKMMNALLDARADAQLQDSSGKTAVDLAVINKVSADALARLKQTS